MSFMCHAPTAYSRLTTLALSLWCPARTRRTQLHQRVCVICLAGLLAVLDAELGHGGWR